MITRPTILPSAALGVLIFLPLVVSPIPTFAQNGEGTEQPQNQQELSRIIPQLMNKSANKLEAIFDTLGIKPSVEFLNCLCPPRFWYAPSKDGPCEGRTVAYGSVVYANTTKDPEAWKSCMSAFGKDVSRALSPSVASVANPLPADCPAPPPGGLSLADAQLAGRFSYSPWPPMFLDASPEQILYDFSAPERAALRNFANEVTAFGQRIEDSIMAYTIPQMIEMAPRIGYKVITDPHADLRLDLELAEIAFRYNPRTGKLETSEYLLKFPVFGEGQNLEVAVGLDEETWDGKMKLGYSIEEKLPFTQIEGKFGFEYDTRAVLTTSLDDEPPPVEPGRLDKLWTGLQSYLAGVDFYFGTAVGPASEIGRGSVALGPEFTWKIKDKYSEALFEDMLAAMDAALEQQKAVEEKRHQVIRSLATQMGVENAQCGTIGDVTKAIHQKIVEEAQRRGIATEGRTIKQIRKDLWAPAGPLLSAPGTPG